MRTDLLARLAAVSFVLPRLVDRAGDLDALIEHFLSDLAVRLAESPKRLAPEARTVLLRAAWPGNVGQLKLVLDRACVVSADHVIHAADLPDALQPAMIAATAGSWPIGSLSAIERLHIIKVLDHCGGNKKAAADVLEIDRSTLYAKLRQYGLA